MRYIAFAVLLTFSMMLTSSSFAQSKLKDIRIQAYKGDITLLEDKSYFDSLLSKINGAKKDIVISMYVFKTTSNKINLSNRIKDALIKAAQQGVEVKVLLERESNRGSSLNSGNDDTASKLARGGVKVYFDLPQKRTHVKAIVIDRRYTFIGSHNLTSSALQHNNELSLMIDSVAVAMETKKYIEEIIGKGERKK